jgi:hypothetical protein
LKTKQTPNEIRQYLKSIGIIVIAPYNKAVVFLNDKLYYEGQTYFKDYQDAIFNAEKILYDKFKNKLDNV